MLQHYVSPFSFTLALAQVSTPKIEAMMDAASNTGALGGKINGSGGGGCMFAYAPAHPEKVAEAIEQAGGKAYIVHSDNGTRPFL